MPIFTGALRVVLIGAMLSTACTGPEDKPGVVISKKDASGGGTDTKPAVDAGAPEAAPAVDTAPVAEVMSPGGTSDVEPRTGGAGGSDGTGGAGGSGGVAASGGAGGAGTGGAGTGGIGTGGAGTGGAGAGGSGGADAANVTPDVMMMDMAPVVIPPTACTASSECGQGTCSTGICYAKSDLLLYWTLDDQAGSRVVTDSSGNGFDGTYVTNSGTLPALSADVPPLVKFPDPAGRTFLLAQRHGASVPIPPLMRQLRNNVTLSAWFKVKDMVLGGNNGSEVVSAGDQLALRVKASEIEFAKRVDSGSGGKFVQCLGASTTQLDGNWHHVAGVTTKEGMKVFLDGVLLKSCAIGNDIRWEALNPPDRKWTDFWVARHGGGSTSGYDFNGDVDDVRFYARPLADSEITWLSTGKP